VTGSLLLPFSTKKYEQNGRNIKFEHTNSYSEWLCNYLYWNLLLLKVKLWKLKVFNIITLILNSEEFNNKIEGTNWWLRLQIRSKLTFQPHTVFLTGNSGIPNCTEGTRVPGANVKTHIYSTDMGQLSDAEGSPPLIPSPTIGHDPEAVPCTSHPHNLHNPLLCGPSSFYPHISFSVFEVTSFNYPNQNSVRISFMSILSYTPRPLEPPVYVTNFLVI
jgi:hypothetical protein